MLHNYILYEGYLSEVGLFPAHLGYTHTKHQHQQQQQQLILGYGHA